MPRAGLRLPAAVFLLSIAIAGSSGLASEPHSDSAVVEVLFDSYFADFIRLNPEAATQLGLPRDGAYKFDPTALNDYSETGIRANYDLARTYLERLRQIDSTRITGSQWIDAKILAWWLSLQIAGAEFENLRYRIDHLTGVQTTLVTLFTEQQPIDGLGDANTYVARLEQVPAQIDQVRERIESQERSGIRPSKEITERVLAAVREFTAGEPRQNLLFLDFQRKLIAVRSIDEKARHAMLSRVETLLRDRLYPAYSRLARVLRASAEQNDTLAGIWKLPEGDRYYAYCLRLQTCTDLTPEQAFQAGLGEVQRLQTHGRRLLDTLGIRGGRTYGELVQQYWSTWNRPENRDRFTYPASDSGTRMILRDYQAYIDEATRRLPEAFGDLPRTPVVVRPVPEYKQAGGITYYEPASLDGKRGATFYINLGSRITKPGMRTLTYHETVPGHHYQMALQQELTQKRMFKNLFFLSGFGEGWAMYVEDLAVELGWLPDTYSRLAEINSQLLRAVRVVLDVGIHYKRWTPGQALQYMQDNLGWSSINEIDRYIVWPGQACSYTIGKLKILELREKARRALGPKFDLKEFHQVVLENGTLPLGLLEDVVDGYIARAK